ncbi:hypothetical protein L3C95_30095 [Chitinophaga filiformis]|uniref:hypothetical protein n=1 Tax=Chitinophaga filiformis TaxID=104663 RepID=UPI001F27F854|nr:hypothetical protein [Chitinophaga filiformis]MCF6407186.1 hypothetical protein [Chitinophaga filiformis]
MKRLFLSAAALVMLFAACSKDENNAKPNSVETETPGKYLLHQISLYDSLEVTYDSANNMKLIKAWDEKGTPLSTTAFIYEDGKLTKVVDEPDGEMKVVQRFEYNSAGKLAKTKFYLTPGSTDISHYDSLVYDANGRLSERYELNNSHSINLRSILVWDSKGNIVRTLGINIPGLPLTDTSITDFTYDDKVNPGAKQPEFFITKDYDPTFGLSANNVVKKVNRLNNDFDNSTVTDYQYTYDQDDYPITRKDSTQVIREGQVTYGYSDFFRYRYTR